MSTPPPSRRRCSACRARRRVPPTQCRQHSAANIWPAEPIGAGAFGAVNGAVTFAFDRAAFAPGSVVRDFKGVARFEPSSIVLDDLSGSLVGGRLTGALTFRHDGDELAAKGHVELTGADAGAAIASEPKWVDGRLTLELAGESVGRSPEALVGALHGAGTIALDDAHVAGIDTAAFDAAMLAADQSNTIEPAKIRAAVGAAMEKGRLTVPQGVADVTVTAGQFRLGQCEAAGRGRRRARPRRRFQSQYRRGRRALDAVAAAGGKCVDCRAARTRRRRRRSVRGAKAHARHCRIGELADAARDRISDPPPRIDRGQPAPRRLGRGAAPAVAADPIHLARNGGGVRNFGR